MSVSTEQGRGVAARSHDAGARSSDYSTPLHRPCDAPCIRGTLPTATNAGGRSSAYNLQRRIHRSSRARDAAPCPARLRVTGPPGSIAAARPLASAGTLSLPSVLAARGLPGPLKTDGGHPHMSCSSGSASDSWKRADTDEDCPSGRSSCRMHERQDQGPGSDCLMEQRPQYEAGRPLLCVTQRGKGAEQRPLTLRVAPMLCTRCQRS